MKQLTDINLRALNQILRDIYSRLLKLPPKIPTYMDVENHEEVTNFKVQGIDTRDLVTVVGCTYRILDERTVLLGKQPLIFEKTGEGYRCVNSVEVPAKLLTGHGDLVRAYVDDTVTFKGPVIPRDTVYLYPLHVQATLIFGEVRD